MSKEKFSFSIFHKLWLALLVVTLVPLLSLWYVGGIQARQLLTDGIAQNLVGTTNTVAASIAGWDETNLRLLRQAATLDDVRSMRAELQNPLLKSIGKNYEWSALVYTIALDGQNIGRNDGKPQLQYGDRAYFQAILAGQPNGRQVIISKTSGKPTLALAAPIKDEAGKLLGVIAMTMNLDVVSKMIADIKIGQTGHAILLDSSYKVIAHGQPARLKTTLQDFSAYPALAVEGVTTRPSVYTQDGKKVVVFERKLPQGWTLLVEQDYDEAYASLEDMERGARILILVTVLLVSAVAYFLGKQLTRPIKRLTTIADELSSGKFDLTIPHTARGDELGSLARAIERLGVSIQMAMERLRRKA